MSKENGFVPIRRGLWEHLRDGRMSPFEALAFVYICSQADTRTGVWKGSAGALVTELGFHPRTARDLLERMEHGGYIRRFVSQGMRRCYPILIHKFPVTQGERNGEVLDALSSTKQDGCLDLRYISCEVHGEVHGEVHASQRRSEKKEERQEKKKEADARYGPFLEFAKTSFEAKRGHPPTWDCFGKDGSALAAFLRRAAHVTLEIWQAHVLNFFDSTEAFTLKKGGSLAYFISQFDSFSSGPILEGGSSNGKQESFEERRQRKSAEALGEVRRRASEVLREVEPTPRLESGEQTAIGRLRRGAN